MRPLPELSGQSSQGKTTGGTRFLRLHGLGKVQGDYSLALVKREGDVGLLIRDNVETENLTRILEDFFLFSSTEGEWGRVGAGRHSEHPVVAVTTIEGIARRQETNRRLLRFEFQRTSDPWEEASILADIDSHRTVIFRGIVELLRCTLAQNPPPVPKTIPAADFVNYCFLLFRLLRVWEEVAGNLYRLGVPVKTIQLILRHANVSTTLSCYVRSVSEDAAAAMRCLEEACTNMHQIVGKPGAHVV